MIPGETDTAGRQWHGTPYQSAQGSTGMVQGVWLNPGEEVDWTWSADGTYIMGYTIRQKEIPKDERQAD